MADKKLTPAEEAELNNLLKERERIESQIAANVQKAANARHNEKKRLDELIKKGDDEVKQLSTKITLLQKKKEYYEYEKGAYKSISSLSVKALVAIKGNAKSAGILANVTKETVKMKQAEMNLDGKALQTSIARRTTLEQLKNEVIQQGESIAKLHGHTANEEEKRMQFEKSISHLTKKQKEEARELYEIKEKLAKKEERIKVLHEQVHHAAHGLPESLTSAAKGAMGLFKAIKTAGMAMGPLVIGLAILGATLHVFMELDKAAGAFRETTGLTQKMTEKIDHDVHHIAMGYRKFGLDAEKAYKVAEELANAQSDMFHFSEATQVSMGLLNTQMGIAVKDSAEVSSMFEQVGRLSESAAASATLDAAKMFADVGVSAKEGFADMAKSAGVLSKHMRGNVQLFVQQAVKAKMLGTTLEDLTKSAEHLLNFESSIEDELTAATMVGGQFNLSRARALAYEGKIAEANEATLDAIQASGDFRQQDYFTQTQLAKAAGKSVEEITRELGVRDKLQSLSGDALKNAQKAIDAGIDIRDLSDEDLKKKADALAANEKIASTMDQINNAIAGAVEGIGGNFTPALQFVGTVIVGIATAFGKIGELITFIKENTWAMVGALLATSALGLMIIGQKITQYQLEKKIRQEKIRQFAPELATAGASMFGSFAKWLGPLGIAAAIAGVAVMSAMAMGLFSKGAKGNDIISPGQGSDGYGKRTLFGPEGAIRLNDRDTVMAGTDMFDNKSNVVASRKITDSPIAAANNNMIGALIQEFRGVRADMASGKIGVYMDGSKVTANVTNTMDNSTRNKFALA